MGDGVLFGVGLKVDPSGVQSGVSEAERSLNHFEGIAKKIGGLVAGYFSFQALKTAALKIHDAADELEIARTRVEGMVRATGGAAGVTAAQIEQLASQISHTTLNTGNSVRAAAAMLLSFRNVTKPIFADTIRVAADMSAAFGEDLSASLWSLGRALEDPARGMMLLRRQGIALSEGEQKAIKSALDHNNVLGAQQIILSALQQRFHGLASELYGTTVGAIHEAKTAWTEFMAAIGSSEAAESLVGRLVTALRDAGVALRYTYAASRAQNIEKMGDYVTFLRGEASGIKPGSPYDRFARIAQGVEGQPGGWFDRLAQRFGLQVPRNAEQARDELQRAERILADMQASEQEDFARSLPQPKNLQATLRRLRRQMAPADQVGPPSPEQQAAATQFARLSRLWGANAPPPRTPEKAGAVGGGEDPAVAARREIERMIAEQRASQETPAETIERQIRQAAEGKGLNLSEIEQYVTGGRMAATDREQYEDRKRKNEVLLRDMEREYERHQQVLKQKDEERARWVEDRSRRGFEAQEALWKRALENTQDSVAGFFDSMLSGDVKSFQDFANRIVAIWRNMVAQMLAEQTLGRLFSDIMGGITGAKVPGNTFGTTPGKGDTSGKYFTAAPTASLVAGPPMRGVTATGPAAGDTYHVSVGFAPSFLDTDQADTWLRSRGHVIRDEVLAGVQASRAYRSALQRG